jgi:predicted alpha-1,2-mannosidase
MKLNRTHVAAALASCLAGTILAVPPALAGTSAASAAAGSPANPASLVRDPTALVDPFLGTGSGGTVVGPVDMFPGASAPFGMLAWSPDTPSRPASGGYNYADSSTIGLSLTHASGAGCGIAGDVPILPTIGAIGTNPTAATEPFSHSAETAHPGSYATTLGTGSSAIGVSLAATTRTGIGEFSYPATTSANMLFKVGDSQASVNTAGVSVVGDNEVTGSVSAGKFCDMPNGYTLYFAAEFDRSFSGYGTWNGTTVTTGDRTMTSRATSRTAGRPAPANAARVAPPGTEAKGSQQRTDLSASGPASGAWVSFDTSTNANVGMKVAVSYVSTAGAEANLRAEDPGWSEPAVAAKTRAQWRGLLSEIRIGGGTHDQQVQFYTALYHALLDPSTFSDANGEYLGMDAKLHRTARGQTQYTTFSGWDIYRDEVPLLAAVAPAQTSAMAQSLVNDAAQGGWLPKWPVANGYTDMMGGDSSDAIIAEAYAFGARDFDTRAALAAMVKGATQVQSSSDLGEGYYTERPGLASYLANGYVSNDEATSGSAVPDGASLTLEYATDDYAISAFAKDLGVTGTSRTFLGRSQNWTSLYNVDSGYLQPRDDAGNFPAGDPVTAGLGSFGQSGFQEGNAAQYAWMVPQDLGGLISAMGGNSAVDARLDTYFTQDNLGPNDPYYWAGNEVDLLAPWIYDYAGQPYKTQAEVHKLLDDVYSDTPGGEPGNDDLGAMSSWYVWGALGMYPQTPGSPVLVLGAPLFPRVQVNLPGHHLALNAPGASDQGYITHMSVNGKTGNRDWLPAQDLTGASGGGATTVNLQISGTPDTKWAAAPADAPPSYASGPLSFPPGVIPSAVTTSPANLTATAGSSAQATLTFTLGVGAYGSKAAGIQQLHWTAQLPPGVTVTPSSGTATVTNDVATVPVTFTVAADAPQGFSSAGFALSSTPAEPLPTLTVPLAIIGSGDTATVCTTLGTANTDNGITQMEGGDGTTAPVTEGGESGRTTVQEVANDLNMYFQVDPRIADNGDFAATVAITYYDAGTNSWQLQYDKHGASAYTSVMSVTNTNTGTWKTVTATLPDAAMAKAENNQADFRIASGSPVVVHSAQATISGAGVLPMNLCPSGA